jgi:hypothetical protein
MPITAQETCTKPSLSNTTTEQCMRENPRLLRNAVRGLVVLKSPQPAPYLPCSSLLRSGRSSSPASGALLGLTLGTQPLIHPLTFLHLLLPLSSLTLITLSTSTSPNIQNCTPRLHQALIRQQHRARTAQRASAIPPDNCLHFQPSLHHHMRESRPMRMGW